ncbi:COMM domain-containing protein 2 isoform X3 [Passer montanus]|uniref:COMM domain-containing protein 2 isoform X3 n=1 Tax=Passer montanus TaxID=9160 RepID=UPI0019608C7E|nr:COMM domain-containing protein 2 isoform X3 [Passer montanus]
MLSWQRGAPGEICHCVRPGAAPGPRPAAARQVPAPLPRDSPWELPHPTGSQRAPVGPSLSRPIPVCPGVSRPVPGPRPRAGACGRRPFPVAGAGGAAMLLVLSAEHRAHLGCLPRAGGAGKLNISVDIIQHGVEGLVYLLTESSKLMEIIMITWPKLLFPDF